MDALGVIGHTEPIRYASGLPTGVSSIEPDKQETDWKTAFGWPDHG
jgi:hypothetical protein